MALKIRVNGDEKIIERDSINVRDLLMIYDVKNPDIVSVQLNGSFLEKTKYENTYVKDGDELEFVYFLGGGSRRK